MPKFLNSMFSFLRKEENNSLRSDSDALFCDIGQNNVAGARDFLNVLGIDKAKSVVNYIEPIGHSKNVKPSWAHTGPGYNYVKSLYCAQSAEAVDLLVGFGVDLYQISYLEKSALHLALDSGRYEVFRALTRHVDTNKLDERAFKNKKNAPPEKKYIPVYEYLLHTEPKKQEVVSSIYFENLNANLEALLSNGFKPTPPQTRDMIYFLMELEKISFVEPENSNKIQAIETLIKHSATPFYDLKETQTNQSPFSRPIRSIELFTLSAKRGYTETFRTLLNYSSVEEIQCIIPELKKSKSLGRIASPNDKIHHGNHISQCIEMAEVQIEKIQLEKVVEVALSLAVEGKTNMNIAPKQARSFKI